MEDITPEELIRRMDAKEDLNIVDVREDWEYDEGNMGAIHIPLGSLPQRVNELEEYKDQELIVHCRSGARSSNAKKYLESQGFTKVRNLLRGFVGYEELTK